MSHITIPHRDSIIITREIDGMTIKATAVRLPIGLYDIKVIDHFGEQTSDTVDIATVWEWIAEMVEAAAATSRERMKAEAEFAP